MFRVMLVMLAFSAGCAEPGAADCVAGTPDCVCAAAGCVGGLPCVDGICIDEEPGTDDGVEPASSTGAQTGGVASSAGEGGGPMIVDFGTNATQITEGQAVTFTATVIDPDGPDDIQGGSLKTADGAVIYGAFADVGNGTFEATVAWEELHAVEPIEFEDATMRSFRADFFDNAGNVDEASISVGLHCESGPGVRACAGRCVSLVEDPEHCGECGAACGEGDACSHGTCAFAWSTCLVDGNEAPSTCAAHCASMGEACVAQCDAFGNAVQVWWEGTCEGFPDFDSADEVACMLPPPEGAASARCCCTVGAAFP